MSDLYITLNCPDRFNPGCYELTAYPVNTPDEIQRAGDMVRLLYGPEQALFHLYKPGPQTMSDYEFAVSGPDPYTMIDIGEYIQLPQ